MTNRTQGKEREAPSRLSLITHHSSLITAFSLGAATVLGFAPFSVFPLPVLTLAVLLGAWSRAATTGRAAFTGFAFGLGFFLCGVSWVYVSLHDFGSMPVPLAVLATLAFCAFLALFPALVAALVAASPVSPTVKLLLVAPAVWTLSEWVRGWIFTGFPWLALGYSQVPASPLAGYAPVVGIYGITLATVATAGLIVTLWQAKDEGGKRKAEGTPASTSSGSSFILHPSSFILPRLLHPSSLILLALWLIGWGLQQLPWTEPMGKPLTASLIQGNVPQDLKWQPERAHATLESYRGLVLSSPGELTVLPETALPMFLEHVPRAYLDALAAHARGKGGDILIGVPERLPGGRYFNSVVSIGRGETQIYRKSHLVPFGEFIPLRPLLGGIVAVLAIPMQDFSAGPITPRPLEVAGQRVAVNICYEDAFGEEIIRQLPHATLLVNVSNVAWFGRSIAPQQHLQISQARALETGRYMLRATNTGVTAVINPRGKVERQAAEFTRAIVTLPVQGYTGATPYVRWGNYAVLLLASAMVIAVFVTARKRG